MTDFTIQIPSVNVHQFFLKRPGIPQMLLRQPASTLHPEIPQRLLCQPAQSIECLCIDHRAFLDVKRQRH
jgi:hypothetical protein